MVVANLTTAIGFGTLALSAACPVLHAVGITVGPGAILALLLSACFAQPAPPAMSAHLSNRRRHQRRTDAAGAAAGRLHDRGGLSSSAGFFSRRHAAPPAARPAGGRPRSGE
jgi:hypothetical protein